MTMEYKKGQGLISQIVQVIYTPSLQYAHKICTCIYPQGPLQLGPPDQNFPKNIM